jgi:hypothetical protein
MPECVWLTIVQYSRGNRNAQSSRQPHHLLAARCTSQTTVSMDHAEGSPGAPPLLLRQSPELYLLEW